MTDRMFLDTNVLVYAYDAHDLAKQKLAQGLLMDALENEIGVVSAQVLGEFFCVVTRRIPKPLTVDEAQEVIENLSLLDVVETDAPMVSRAIDLVKAHRIAYWDALIVAAAERARCTVIYSEDLNAGQDYAGIRLVNPFAAPPRRR